jgi:hypothetical protein
MSDVRIGLAVEGPTDAIVLRAGLTAFLRVPFTVATLQPQTPPGQSGTGWGGVFRWCRQAAAVRALSLADNPLLQNHDIIIIQVDADVASFEYGQAGIWEPPVRDLPCEKPCPPASDTVDALNRVVCGWLAPTLPGPKGLVCIPSKCMEAWVAAALYGERDPGLMEGLECPYDVVSYLHKRSAKERLIRSKNGSLHKVKSRYARVENEITQCWNRIKEYCPQAERFQEAVEGAFVAS